MRVATSLLVLLLLAGACSDDTDVSGLWEMREDSALVQFEQFGEPFKGRVKLAIDQFGWDVAGVLLIYRDGIYYDMDSCHYLVDGEVRDETLLFSVALGEEKRLIGSLTHEKTSGDRLLTGQLTDPDGVMPPLDIVLERVGGDREVHQEEWDLGCP